MPLPPGAEEAYWRAPDRTDTVLQQLGRATDRKVAQTNALSEENAQHQRDRWGAGEKALDKGIAQYDKSYERAYRNERDSQNAGRTDEQHKAYMEDANRRNRMAGSEEAYLNTAGADGRPRWQQEREETLKQKREEQALNSQSVRSGIAMNNAQMKRFMEDDRIAKEDRQVGVAASEYAKVMALPEHQRPQAMAAVDAQFPDLTPQARTMARNKGSTDFAGAQMAQNITFAGSDAGREANEKVGALDAKVHHASTLSNDLAEYKKAMMFGEEERGAYNRLVDKLDQIKPGTKERFDNEMRLNTGGSRQSRLAAVISGVRTELEGEYARINGQYQNAPSPELRQRLQRIGVGLQQLRQTELQAAPNSLQLVGGGSGGNAAFLRGGQGGMSQGMQQYGQSGGMAPISFAPGQQAPQQPAPSMRGSQINRPVPAAGAPTR